MAKKKIPVIISPFFLIFAAIFSVLVSKTIPDMFLWFIIIFVSVFFHEMGHALTALAFKQNVQIEFVALGGVTSYKGRPLSFKEQFLIVLDGPIFGFLLSLILYLLYYSDFFTISIIQKGLYIGWKINIFWSSINLLPVLPLDGGQLLRIAFEGIFGVKGFKASLLVGVAISTLISLYFFLLGWLLVGSLFFLFAYQGFDTWRKLKFISSSDRKAKYVAAIQLGEREFEAGNIDEAKKIFENLREKTKKRAHIWLCYL